MYFFQKNKSVPSNTTPPILKFSLMSSLEISITSQRMTTFPCLGTVEDSASKLHRDKLNELVNLRFIKLWQTLKESVYKWGRSALQTEKFRT